MCTGNIFFPEALHFFKKDRFMSDTRRPYERLLRIHNRLMLRRPHTASKKELMSLCQIAERTLKGDISYMRDVLDAPVFYNRREKGWQYTEEYDISQHLGFTEKQFNKLRLGLEIISRYQRFHLIEEEESSRMQRKLQLADSNPYHRYIHFEQAPYYKGAELVGLFLQAIEEYRPIQFQYESYKNPSPVKRVLQPYVLKERDHRWYVIGKLPAFDGALATYALDRIQQDEQLVVLEEYFSRDQSFDVEALFQHSYGMTILDAPVQDVMLQFSPLQARYFQSKPFYPYEFVDQSEQGLTVWMKVIPNWEFVHKLMSLGDGVKVLAPETLQNQLLEELQRAISMYA
jgi:predicted DNA-binding transcriptional regulator YafY